MAAGVWGKLRTGGADGRLRVFLRIGYRMQK